MFCRGHPGCQSTEVVHDNDSSSQMSRRSSIFLVIGMDIVCEVIDDQHGIPSAFSSTTHSFSCCRSKLPLADPDRRDISHRDESLARLSKYENPRFVGQTRRLQKAQSRESCCDSVHRAPPMYSLPFAASKSSQTKMIHL